MEIPVHGLDAFTHSYVNVDYSILGSKMGERPQSKDPLFDQYRYWKVGD
jgi:hypothetical protein